MEFTLDYLGGKWKTCILSRLKDNPMRYGELRACLPRLSDKMLSERLHELEVIGLVERTLQEGSHSYYQLTDRAESLRPVLEVLYGWGEDAAGEFAVQFDCIDKPSEAEK